MKLLFRILLSLSFLLVHGFGATPVAAGQLILNKKSVEIKALKKGAGFDYKAANEFPSICEGEVEDSETDFVEDTEAEDETDDISSFKKYGGAVNYFCAFYGPGDALSLHITSAAYSADAHSPGAGNDRCVLFRVFRI